MVGGVQRSRTDRTEQQRALGCPEGNGFDLHEPLFILEDHELGAITEESADASPDSASPTKLPSPAHLARELKELVKELSSSAQGELVTRPHPHILQLSHVMDGPMSERVKNDVYQLARRYSLRVKSKSVAARPSLQWEQVAPTIPHLQEEAEAPARGPGKRKPVLSLFNHEQPTAPEHSPPESGSARETSPRCVSLSPSAASPKTTAPGSWPSLRSPFDMETCNWPDMRELCSKYSSHDEALQAKGGRPRSLPEDMMEPPLSGRVGRCCSLKARRGPGGQGRSAPASGGPPPRGSDGEEALYVTTDLTLEDNRRVIVMEKGPRPSPALGMEATSRQGPSSPAGVEGQGQGQKFQESAENRPKEEGPRDPADPSQQGRVRSLRERFQALNSVG
ncbi:LOW QUALITY PROTEIN: pleckstrin homology domain-containing family G member 3-like [Vicugna pacos]|uniref:LOW QUALITY PROTEIN: pleckstrin homology domain-containing family G member 3-like n=1 Tax=Vicugna pacos TaxID=30538 RepID=A0ABM5CR02_VICPA